MKTISNNCKNSEIFIRWVLLSILHTGNKSILLFIAVLLIYPIKEGAYGSTYNRLNEVPEDSHYWLQGEYVGTVRNNDETWRLGAQVAAMGDNYFKLLLYKGGLPGEGGNTLSDVKQLETELDNGRLVFMDNEHIFIVQNQKLAVVGKREDKIITTGILDRIVRKSPTLGLKPPENAKVLFNGTDVSKWQEGAEKTEDSLLQQGATSRQEFGDKFIHLEYLLPYWPEGMTNSGVYIQRRYEVQILATYGKFPLEKHHDAALYNERKPDVKMTLPPLQWQSFDILFRAPRFDGNGKKIENARLTVLHNGTLVHENVELDGGTGAGGRFEEVEKAELYLQDHTGECFFRNVWIIENALDWPAVVKEAVR